MSNPTSSSSSEKGRQEEEHTSKEPSSKKLRLSDPDLKIVLTWEDEDGVKQTKEYQEYSHAFALLSKFVDTALSVQMKEKEEKTITFPNVSAETFELATKSVKCPVAARTMKLEDVVKVVEFYHRYDFTSGLELCNCIMKECFEKEISTRDQNVRLGLDVLVNAAAMAGCSATRPTSVANPKIHPPNLKMSLHTTNYSRNSASSSCSRMKAVWILLTLNFLWISSNTANNTNRNSRTYTSVHALSPVSSSMAKKHRLFSTTTTTTPWQFHGVGTPNDAALSGTRSTRLFLTAAPTTTTREEKVHSHQNKTETDHDDQGEESDSRRTATRRGLAVSAEIELPFPAEIAYDTFSDLPRQPEWSPWLHSVEYIIAKDKQSSPVSSSSTPATKWTLKVLGVSYSWISVATKQDKVNYIIEWESVSGLKNFGRVQFDPHPFQPAMGYDKDENDTMLDNPQPTLTTRDEHAVGCHMTMTMTFVPPRLVAAVFRNSKGLQHFMEQKLVGSSLKSFSDIVVEEILTTGSVGGGEGGSSGGGNRTLFFPI